MEEQSDAIEGGNFFLGVLVSIGLLVAGSVFGYLIYFVITQIALT
jgi:hypothetical protein